MDGRAARQIIYQPSLACMCGNERACYLHGLLEHSLEWPTPFVMYKWHAGCCPCGTRSITHCWLGSRTALGKYIQIFQSHFNCTLCCFVLSAPLLGKGCKSLFPLVKYLHAGKGRLAVQPGRCSPFSRQNDNNQL